MSDYWKKKYPDFWVQKSIEIWVIMPFTTQFGYKIRNENGVCLGKGVPTIL